MINFNKGKEVINKYGGSENKKTIIYNNETYMIKFPEPTKKINVGLSYTNNQFSEDIGCS